MATPSRRHSYFHFQLNLFRLTLVDLQYPVIMTKAEFQYLDESGIVEDYSPFLRVLSAPAGNPSGKSLGKWSNDRCNRFINLQLRTLHAPKGRDRKDDSILLYAHHHCDAVGFSMQILEDFPCEHLSPILRMAIYYTQWKESIEKEFPDLAECVQRDRLSAQDAAKHLQEAGDMLITAYTCNEKSLKRPRKSFIHTYAKLRRVALPEELNSNSYSTAVADPTIPWTLEEMFDRGAFLVPSMALGEFYRCIYNYYGEDRKIDMDVLKPLVIDEIDFYNPKTDASLRESPEKWRRLACTLLPLAFDRLLRMMKKNNKDIVYVTAVNLCMLISRLAGVYVELANEANMDYYILRIVTLCCYIIDPGSCKVVVIPQIQRGQVVDEVVDCIEETFPLVLSGKGRHTAEPFNIGDYYVNTPCPWAASMALTEVARFYFLFKRHNNHGIKLRMRTKYPMTDSIALEPQDLASSTFVQDDVMDWFLSVIRVFLGALVYSDDIYRPSTEKAIQAVKNYCQSKGETAEEDCTEPQCHSEVIRIMGTICAHGKRIAFATVEDLMVLCALHAYADSYTVKGNCKWRAAPLYLSRGELTPQNLKLSFDLPPAYYMYSMINSLGIPGAPRDPPPTFSCFP